MIKDAALDLALAYIQEVDYGPYDSKPVITAIKQARAAPAQEPVGTLNINSYKGLGNYDFDYFGSLPDGTYSVYTTPPAQEPPPECKTEAEKRAYAFGWWKALEANRAATEREAVAIPDCGEAGHADGACGSRECLPSFRRNPTPPAAPTQGETK